jgi:hypothetical protein
MKTRSLLATLAIAAFAVAPGAFSADLRAAETAAPAEAAPAPKPPARPAPKERSFIGHTGIYFKDRFHDLLDIFRLRVGIPENGKAIGVKARATSLAQAGYVHFRGKMVGIERRALGIMAERRTEGGVSVLYGSLNEMEPLRGNSFLKANSDWSAIEDRRIVRQLPYWDDGRNRHLGVGAEVATPLLGFDAGVYPEEAIDFVLGWLTLDIYDDDELLLANYADAEATTAREPDATAPFRAKREELQAFDDRYKTRKALEEDAVPRAAAEEDAPTTATLELRAPSPSIDPSMSSTLPPGDAVITPPADPAMAEKDALITPDDADRAIRKADNGGKLPKGR